MRISVKPVVVVSKCLGFAACRYNGLTIPDAFVKQLAPQVEFIPVCPEVEIGLGVPRDPVRVVEQGGALRLYQPATERDWTEAMQTFAERFLTALPPVEGFILKSRSPSCGMRDTKIYRGTRAEAPVIRKGQGFFGGAVLARFPHTAVEDEARLSNARIREHFLTQIFTLATFRAVREQGTAEALGQFQAQHKLLLMAYHERELRALGKIAANHAKRPLAEVFADYQAHLGAALARPPRYTANINALMHALGYFSRDLSSEEKAFFLDLLEKYRAGRTPLHTLLSVLNAWVIRFGVSYLAQQAFFEPFPEALMDGAELVDPQRKRDYWS